MKGLTKKQKNIVEFIGDFNNTMGMAPTIYEIAEHFGIKTSTVFAHIRALQRKAVLQRSSKARSISLTKQQKKQKLPIGAQAVPVIESTQNPKTAVPAGSLVCDTRLFSRGIGVKDVFALHVKGADMAGIGVHDGDMLLIKSAVNSIGQGDLLLTEENGKAAIHACSKCADGVFELKSAKNGTVRSTVYHNFSDIPLHGIVIGLQRSF